MRGGLMSRSAQWVCVILIYLTELTAALAGLLFGLLSVSAVCVVIVVSVLLNALLQTHLHASRGAGNK